MIELTSMTDTQIINLIRNHEEKNARDRPLYSDLLIERARRGQIKSGLSFDKSLELLRRAAIEQRCITYGDLAKASGLPWNLARHQMNGPNGHLDRLLDICHVNGLPMLPAICVNKNGVETGELEPTALKGFADGARRLGLSVVDERAFHAAQRDNCWDWGKINAVGV